MSYVYFIRVDGYVKIGYSYDPQQRIKTILHGTVHPELLDRSRPRVILRLIEDCTMKDERRLQEYFSHFHAVGEWYHYTPVFTRMLRDLEYETIREERLRIRRAKAAAKAAAPQAA